MRYKNWYTFRLPIEKISSYHIDFFFPLENPFFVLSLTTRFDNNKENYVLKKRWVRIFIIPALLSWTHITWPETVVRSGSTIHFNELQYLEVALSRQRWRVYDCETFLPTPTQFVDLLLRKHWTLELLWCISCCLLCVSWRQGGNPIALDDYWNHAR